MFFKYIQAARVHFWEKTGLIESYEKDRLGPMLLSAGCQFKKPLFYPGSIIIKTHLSFIKHTSFGLEHHIFNNNNEIVTVGEDVVVIYNYHLHQKAEIPGWLKANMEELHVLK